MPKLSKKQKKQILIYLIVLVTLLLWCVVEYCHAAPSNQRGTVLNRSPIVFSFRKVTRVATDGDNVYLLSNDEYVTMLDEAGKKVRHFFPCEARHRIPRFFALAFDRDRGTLLLYVPGVYIKEFTNTGELLHRYEGRTPEDFSALPRFAGVDLAQTFAKQMRCVLDNGAVFEVHTFFPIQWITRTDEAGCKLIYLFPTPTVTRLFYFYFIAGFIMLWIALDRASKRAGTSDENGVAESDHTHAQKQEAP